MFSFPPTYASVISFSFDRLGWLADNTVNKKAPNRLWLPFWLRWMGWELSCCPLHQKRLQWCNHKWENFFQSPHPPQETKEANWDRQTRWQWIESFFFFSQTPSCLSISFSSTLSYPRSQTNYGEPNQLLLEHVSQIFPRKTLKGRKRNF